MISGRVSSAIYSGLTVARAGSMAAITGVHEQQTSSHSRIP